MAKKVQFTNRNLVAMIFCSKNCSDLLWKKNALVIEIFLDITRTIFETEYILFWLITGGFCRSLFTRMIKMQVGTNKWDVKTCRKKSKKVVWFAKRGAKNQQNFTSWNLPAFVGSSALSRGVGMSKIMEGGGHNLPPPDWNRVKVSAKNCWGPVSPPRSYTFRYPYSEEGLENCSLINCLVSVLLMSAPLWPDYVKYRLKIVYFRNFSVFSKT